MKFWLDHEASSLNKGSYPIEVGWIDEDGNEEGYLITPADNWTDWSSDSAKIHGIDRQWLYDLGKPIEFVAERIAEVLGNHKVYSDAPPWDQYWLNRLFDEAGIPNPITLIDTDHAEFEALYPLKKMFSQDGAGEIAFRDMAIQLLAEAHFIGDGKPRIHRAIEDSRDMRDIYLYVKKRTVEILEKHSKSIDKS